MKAWTEIINYLLSEDVLVFIVAIVIGAIIWCLYPYQPDGKTEITKDENGDVTYKHFHLK